MNPHVRYTPPESGVAEILIDRPERHNAMTTGMYEAMLDAIARSLADASTRCLLFRGAGGKSFISGTDIGHFQHFREGSEGLAYEAFVERVIDAVERIPVPTIAVIDGWAVGGGLALAAACDFRVCGTGARFGAPLAKTLSNTLSSRNLARLLAAFGLPRVKKMLLLAEPIDAQEAQQCGFVLGIHPPDALDAAARDLAQRLVALSPVTQEAVKEGLRRLVSEQSQQDADLIERVYASPEFHRGVARFTAGKAAKG